MNQIFPVIILLGLCAAYGSRAVAADQATGQFQMIIQSCDTPNNLDTVKQVEIYGVVDETTGSISNLALLEVVPFDVGDLKMISQGGDITGTPGSDVTYNHLLGGEATLSVKNNIGTLIYKDKQTIFAHCR